MENNNNNTGAIGYKQETIEIVLNLLNNLPVKTYAETQAKMKIYETLLNPDYDLTPKQVEND